MCLRKSSQKSEEKKKKRNCRAEKKDSRGEKNVISVCIRSRTAVKENGSLLPFLAWSKTKRGKKPLSLCFVSCFFGIFDGALVRCIHSAAYAGAIYKELGNIPDTHVNAATQTQKTTVVPFFWLTAWMKRCACKALLRFLLLPHSIQIIWPLEIDVRVRIRNA